MKAQCRKTFWTSNSAGNKEVKPDIVVMDRNGNPVWVIDTKWKCPAAGKPSDADLKQMYVYHHYWKVNKTALLYPSTKEQGEKYEGHFIEESTPSAQCSMFFIPLDCLKNPANNLAQFFFP